jgi:cysteine-rich repeat protein
VHVSPDRRTVTLFYAADLPASARVRVTVDGNRLRGEGGIAVDADVDGSPGGVALVDFDTLSLTALPGTAVCGRVFASELAAGDSDMSLNVPLAGVTITVDGMEEELWTVTDALGNFRLEPAPAGRFFVHIDGRTATAELPEGAYYPFVGKAWESVPGTETNIGEVYLPLVEAGTLQPVSQVQDTDIGFPPSVLEDFPEFADVQVTVPADSLFSDDGTRGGMVGIAPVPPDRLPGQLPPGLNFPLVITVQTDGATNFDVPVPACFPNLPDADTGQPLPAGSESALFSFNHDTGRFEVVGEMTVSEDGLMVCTDPGVGILAPGWHGTQPGVGAGGGPMFGPLGPVDCSGEDCVPGCPICDPPCPRCTLGLFDVCCQTCGDGLLCKNCGEECDKGDANGPDGTCTMMCNENCKNDDHPGCMPPAGPNADCQASFCDEETGECASEPGNEGGSCRANDACIDMPGTCSGGRCEGAMPAADGTPCDDGQECTENDSCMGGTCRGEPVSGDVACCGNGRLDPGEECDQENDNSFTPNSCRPDCTTPQCGDGILDDQFGETCDDGAANNDRMADACRTSCTKARCGDGWQDSREACDDGNASEGDGCSSDCLLECGNGRQDPGEECDDGNMAAADGCSPMCRIEECGNGILDPNEECDEGTNNADAPNACRPGCIRPAAPRPVSRKSAATTAWTPARCATTATSSTTPPAPRIAAAYPCARTALSIRSLESNAITA